MATTLTNTEINLFFEIFDYRSQDILVNWSDYFMNILLPFLTIDELHRKYFLV